jgi:thiol-disulfide isomerase/thioredoxin
MSNRLESSGCYVVAVAIAIVSAGCAEREQVVSQLKDPQLNETTVATPVVSATELRFPDAQGRLQAPFPGNDDRLTVLVFTRSDCPISNRYAPEVARLHEEFHDHANFWLVYVDPETTTEAIRQHVEEYSYPCGALLDTEHQLVDLSGAKVTPEAAIFDQNGERLYTGRIDNLYANFGTARQAASVHDLQAALSAAVVGGSIPQPSGPAVGCYISDLR